jgi:hypothetical protein
VAARYPLVAVSELWDDGELGYWGAYAAKFIVTLPQGDVELVGVHLETPREGIESLLKHGVGARKDICRELERRAQISELARKLAGDSPTAIVAGDFNMPVESAIYRHDWAGFTNAFSTAGLGFGHTKQTRWLGIRIDHVLAGRGWNSRRCRVGADVGSDHRPLLADFSRVATVE